MFTFRPSSIYPIGLVSLFGDNKRLFSSHVYSKKKTILDQMSRPFRVEFQAVGHLWFTAPARTAVPDVVWQLVFLTARFSRRHFAAFYHICILNQQQEHHCSTFSQSA